MSHETDPERLEMETPRAESAPDGYKKILRSLKKLLGFKKKVLNEQSSGEDKTRIIGPSSQYEDTDDAAAMVTQNMVYPSNQSNRSTELIPRGWKPTEEIQRRQCKPSSDVTSDTGEQNVFLSSQKMEPPTNLDDLIETEYNFNHPKRGYAVLIIYEQFEDQPERKNAYLDCYFMQEMFKALDFEVILVKNKSSKDLLDALADIRNSIKDDCDCFACVISSHGVEISASSPTKGDKYKIREHVIFTADGVVRTEELLEQFEDRKCRQLRGKPRLFFIQACRCKSDSNIGDDVDKGTEVLVQIVPDHLPEKSGQRKYGSMRNFNETGVTQREKSDVDSGKRVTASKPEVDSSKQVSENQSEFHSGKQALESEPDTKGIYTDYQGSNRPPQRYLATFDKRYQNLLVDVPQFPSFQPNRTRNDIANDRMENELESSLALLTSLTEDLERMSITSPKPKTQHINYSAIPFADDKFGQMSYERQQGDLQASNIKPLNEKDIVRPRGNQVVQNRDQQWSPISNDQQFRNDLRNPTPQAFNKPRTTTNYRIKPSITDVDKPIEFCQIPCFNDFLVMFSSASETIAWSDDGKGGWLMYCLYKVIKSLADSGCTLDLLHILTDVSGKMARELQAFTPSKPHYDEAKSAASIYHRLTKDIYLRPKRIKTDITTEL